MSVNAIGPYSFVTIDGGGMPQDIHQTVDVFQRPGVDGSGIFRDGVRGRPFVLRTGVDGIGRQFAFASFNNYTGLVGANPVSIISGGVFLGSISALFAVLDVRLLGIESVALALGGTTPGADTWLTAEWSMLPIHVSNSG